jgi:hypothetical protein
MEAACSSNMLVPYHITTQYDKPEDNDMNLYHHERFRSYMILQDGKPVHQNTSTSSLPIATVLAMRMFEFFNFCLYNTFRSLF